MIEGGEGDLYPSPQTNVTIEFSMHTLSGFKLLDQTSFNMTMMEFPFVSLLLLPHLVRYLWGGPCPWGG